MQTKRHDRYFTWNVPRALELAQGMLAKLKLEPPVDILRVAHEIGVQSVEPADLSIDGYLGRSPDGSLLIRYNRANSHHRNRFTIAHEIGHLFLFRASGQPVPTLVTRQVSRNNQEENGANQVAAELLMPANELARRIPAIELSWRSLSQLAREFNVSIRAMATRVIELSSQPALLMRTVTSNNGVSSLGRLVCSSSKDYDIQFFQRPLELAARMTTDTDELTKTFVVNANGLKIELECQVMNFDGFGRTESWLLCYPTRGVSKHPNSSPPARVSR